MLDINLLKTLINKIETNFKKNNNSFITEFGEISFRGIIFLYTIYKSMNKDNLEKNEFYIESFNSKETFDLTKFLNLNLKFNPKLESYINKFKKNNFKTRDHDYLDQNGFKIQPYLESEKNYIFKYILFLNGESELFHRYFRDSSIAPDYNVIVRFSDFVKKSVSKEYEVEKQKESEEFDRIRKIIK